MQKILTVFKDLFVTRWPVGDFIPINKIQLFRQVIPGSKLVQASELGQSIIQITPRLTFRP